MLIRTRITLVSLGATLLVAITLVVASYSAQRAAEARFVEVSLSGKRVLLDQLLARHASEMGAFTKALTRDSVTLKALRKGDLKVLQDQIETTHNFFYADGSLDRLQLFDTEGRYLASRPRSFTGETAKPLVKAAAAKAVMLSGLTRDDDGVLQASLAFPLYARGKLRGIAVYSRDFQRIIDDIRRSDGADVFVFDSSGTEMLRSSESIDEQLVWTPMISAQGALDVVKSDGRYHAVSTLPLTNYVGDPIGLLSVARDETETYQVQAVAKYTSAGIALLVLLTSAVGLFLYIRRAFRPINGVVSSMMAVAEGDLTEDTSATGRTDETGILITAMSHMAANLRTLVNDMAQTAEALTSAGDDLRQVTKDSNEIIARQSEETDQVATAINELSANVQEVAMHAGAAAEASSEGTSRAAEGQAVVRDTVQSINDLATEIEHAGTAINNAAHESKNINAVLDVIHSISEQTNLLALNAAIEAARAGEQGRGFAVVADEVRTLASRTKASTEEIQQMISRLQAGTQRAVEVIDASRRSSQTTVEHAGSAGDSLAAITASIERSDSMNRQIANSMEEQRSVAEMINGSVVHIAESSRSHRVSTDAASVSISELSNRLSTIVQRFKL